MHQKKIIKSAISVYNPDDPLEREIQEAYHQFHDDWLFAYPCQLFTRALIALKSVDDTWLDSPHLLKNRLSYFFSPFMTRKNDNLVFVTHLLFLRDILENNKINNHLHNPVVFMTTPIAHYLFREYPVHIFVDGNKLLERNKLIQVGGLFITEDFDVDISDCVKKVSDKGRQKAGPALERVVEETIGLPRKVAASPIGEDVFKIDEHERYIFPGAFVWDKNERREGKVLEVEPGETGSVRVDHADGIINVIPKQEFDLKYTIV